MTKYYKKVKTLLKKIRALLASDEVYKEIQFENISRLSFDNLPNEEIELLLLRYFLTKDSVFFDIGANIGVYSYQASKIVNETHIYAFEPNPDSFGKLKRLFKKSNLYNLAFTSNLNSSKSNFKIPVIQGKTYKTRGTLNTQYKEANETSYKIIEVNVETIDSFVKRTSIDRIDFIKIDVEGHEEEVLKGGFDTISQLTPILQVEIEQRHNEFAISRIFDNMKSIGYSCYYFDPSEFRLTKLIDDPVSLQQTKDFKTANYINNFYFFHERKITLDFIDSVNTDIQLQLTNKHH